MCARRDERARARSHARERERDDRSVGQTHSYECPRATRPFSRAGPVVSCSLLREEDARELRGLRTRGRLARSDRARRDMASRLAGPLLSSPRTRDRLSTVARDDAFAGIGRGAGYGSASRVLPPSLSASVSRVCPSVPPYDRLRELIAHRTHNLPSSSLSFHLARRREGDRTGRERARADYLSR